MFSIKRGTDIRAELLPILGIGDFRRSTQLELRILHKHLIVLNSSARIWILRKNAVLYKFQNVEESFFEQVSSFLGIFQLPLNTANHKCLKSA